MPLHLVTTWDVTCDGCGAEMGGGRYGTQQSARAWAEVVGWHVSVLGAALCPDCDGENE